MPLSVTSTVVVIMEMLHTKPNTEWPVRPIGELLRRVRQPVDVQLGQTYQEIGIRSHCKGIFHKTPTTGEEIGNKRVFWVEPGCLIFNIIFAWEQAVAMTSENEAGMIASHRFPMYTSRNGKLLPEYAWRYFSSSRGKYDLGIASPGGAGRNKTLGQAEFDQLKIPVPPMAHQRMAADTLVAADRAIARTEDLIAAKRQLKKGLSWQLITGKCRLPKFDGAWTSVSLGELAVISMGSSPPSSSYNDHSDGLPLIQGNADTINRRSAPRVWTSVVTTTCDVGDILLSVRAPVGKISISDHNACIGRGIASIRAHPHCSQGYLYQALLRVESQWFRLSQGSTFTAINSNDLRSLPIELPEEIAEQEAIAKVLCIADRQVEILESKLAALYRLKKGLMQKLLSGEFSVKTG